MRWCSCHPPTKSTDCCGTRRRSSERACRCGGRGSPRCQLFHDPRRICCPRQLAAAPGHHHARPGASRLFSPARLLLPGVSAARPTCPSSCPLPRLPPAAKPRWPMLRTTQMRPSCTPWARCGASRLPTFGRSCAGRGTAAGWTVRAACWAGWLGGVQRAARGVWGRHGWAAWVLPLGAGTVGRYMQCTGAARLAARQLVPPAPCCQRRSHLGTFPPPPPHPASRRPDACLLRRPALPGLPGARRRWG